MWRCGIRVAMEEAGRRHQLPAPKIDPIIVFKLYHIFSFNKISLQYASVISIGCQSLVFVSAIQCLTNPNHSLGSARQIETRGRREGFLCLQGQHKHVLRRLLAFRVVCANSITTAARISSSCSRFPTTIDSGWCVQHSRASQLTSNAVPCCCGKFRAPLLASHGNGNPSSRSMGFADCISFSFSIRCCVSCDGVTASLTLVSLFPFSWFLNFLSRYA